MHDKYTKVVYQSEPIGKEKIILYLTTFDLETFKNDEKLEKIPEQRKAIAFEFNKSEILNNPNLVEEMSNKIETMFKEIYEKQLLDMKSYIELLRNIKIAPMEYSNAKNITNSDDVHCNIVEGNITNCDNVYCNEIKGNVVNCDKIVYKNKEEI